MSAKPLDFLTRFALTSILGSAAIILVAPFVRPATLPEWLAEPSQAVHANLSLATLADRLADALLWSPSARQPTAATAPGAAPATATEPPRWAIVVAAEAPAYRTQGQFWQRLTAGTAVTVHGERASSVGTMILCRLPPPAPPGASEFLMRRDQLDVHDGALDAVTPEQLEVHQQHARLRAELDQLRTSENGRNRQDNPHWPGFDRARNAYNQSAKRAADLRRRFDQATGDERMRLTDELRQLKSEEARLAQELAVARRAYDAWNAVHPVATQPTSPRIQALEAELASLATQLPANARAP